MKDQASSFVFEIVDRKVRTQEGVSKDIDAIVCRCKPQYAVVLTILLIRDGVISRWNVEIEVIT